MTSSAIAINGWVLIERPILDVFRYVFNPHRFPEWVPFYAHTRPHASFAYEPPHYVIDAELGMRGGIRDTIRCVDVVPGRSITFKGGVVPQSVTYTFEPTSRGTVLSATHVPWGFSSINPFIGLYRPWFEDWLKQALLILKQRLESMRHRPQMRPIFFSYRRQEDRYTGGRVCDALANEFGLDAIFRDVDSIGAGDFQERIERALDEASVLIAFIGPGWFDGFKTHQQDNTKDWVLQELKTALDKPQGKCILPVVVEGAIPDPPVGEAPASVELRGRGTRSLAREIEALPKELKSLARHQFHRLRPDPDFRSDMERVIRSAWQHIDLKRVVDDPQVGAG